MINNNRENSDHSIAYDAAEPELFEEYSSYMKGYLDIEAVKNDPEYDRTYEAARAVVSGYLKKNSRNTENEKFILESLGRKFQENSPEEEIRQIKQEIKEGGINEIASELVREWNEKSQKNGSGDPGTDKNRKFIQNSLEKKETIPVKGSTRREMKGVGKIVPKRYILLAAASILGAILLIKPLITSDDPGTIFDRYYEPFPVFSEVSRNPGNNENESIAAAIESYRSGDYLNAAARFSVAGSENSLQNQATFFQGVSEIALGNYTTAIDLLGKFADQQTVYFKDAKWYLGLSYLKTGNSLKATECFEILARSPGFYSKRSEKILRLLK